MKTDAEFQSLIGKPFNDESGREIGEITAARLEGNAVVAEVRLHQDHCSREFGHFTRAGMRSCFCGMLTTVDGFAWLK